MSNSELTKNDICWNQLFDDYQILDNIERTGSFLIKSTQINRVRQARLMTKFDHKKNLPKIFKKNKLSILPVTRGNYIISQFDAYSKIIHNTRSIERVTDFPLHIESLDYENIKSEAIAINCAYISNMLSEFLEEEQLYPTLNGRMSSNQFDFNIRNVISRGYVSVNVNNSQLEIDGTFEGASSIALIEAKNSISDDFIIRQLYYPYRLLNEMSSINKRIRPIFLIYSNGIFSLYEYRFNDPLCYNSLEIIKQKNYCIEPFDIEINDIENILQQVEIVSDPELIPFPQANNFKRVINLCELLYENNTLTRDEVTIHYDFDVRQTNYYTDAARYLGLIDKKVENSEIKYYLTSEGEKIFNLTIRKRQLLFVKLILSHEAYNRTMKLWLRKLEIPTKDEIVTIMKESGLGIRYNLDTLERRSSTISGWLKWILDLLREG